MMVVGNYETTVKLPLNDVYVDTLDRLRNLTLEITLKLGEYADISLDHILLIGNSCNTAINYFERKEFDKVKKELAKLNCGSIKPRIGEYEEALTYYQDMWRLEIIGIWLSIEFLKGKDINNIFGNQIGTHALIQKINDFYNQTIEEMKKPEKKNKR